MPSVTFAPSSVSHTDSSGDHWSNPNGIYSAGTGTPAVDSLGGVDTASIGVTGTFDGSIPTDAIIIGIEFGGDVWGDVADGVVFDGISLSINGIGTTGLGSGGSVPTSATPVSFGGPTSIPTGLESVTPTDVNDGSTEIGLAFAGNGGDGGNVRVSNWSAIVYYTLGGVVGQVVLVSQAINRASRY
jgi:hypothetical protein